MGFFDKNKSADQPQQNAPLEVSLVKGGTVSLTKGSTVKLDKSAGGDYTIITTWGSKDYDLYALVEYTDGHVEEVALFGTDKDRNFSARTRDDAVVHVSGDQTAYTQSTPQEVLHVRLNPDIRAVAPVVYSAQNSGPGSFRKYRVSTWVIEGLHQNVPQAGTKVGVDAVDASSDDNVYSFVPAVIHNGPDGPSVEAVELYSRRSSENRPAIRDGHVSMDAGPLNLFK